MPRPAHSARYVMLYVLSKTLSLSGAASIVSANTVHYPITLVLSVTSFSMRDLFFLRFRFTWSYPAGVLAHGACLSTVCVRAALREPGKAIPKPSRMKQAQTLPDYTEEVPHAFPSAAPLPALRARLLRVVLQEVHKHRQPGVPQPGSGTCVCVRPYARACACVHMCACVCATCARTLHLAFVASAPCSTRAAARRARKARPSMWFGNREEEVTEVLLSSCTSLFLHRASNFPRPPRFWIATNTVFAPVRDCRCATRRSRCVNLCHVSA